jgi:PST family polysaccharide transporter
MFKIKNLFNSEEKKRLVANFLSLSILQGVNYILPLITFPYLVRVLGVEKFGLLSFATATIAYFSMLTDYGFNLTATREISIYRDNKEKLSEIFNSVMIIKFFLIIISFLLLLFLIFSFNKFKEDYLIYILTFGMVIGRVLFPQWFFQGIEKMKYITFLNILARIVFTVAIFVFIHKESDYWKVPLINSLGFISAGLMALYIVFFKYKIKLIIIKFSILKNYFIYNFQFFVSRVAVNIYTTSNIFFLGLVFNNTIVGYYSIAEKLFKILQSIYGILTQVIYPFMAKNKNIEFLKKILYGSFIFNLVFIFILIIFIPDIMKYIFHINSHISIDIFYILMVANIFILPTYLLGYPFLGVFGYEKFANLSVIYGAFLHIFIILFLIIFKMFNVYTLAISVVITELFILIYRINKIKRFRLWVK